MRKKLTLATMFGIGLAPFAPGTFGSAAAVLLAIPVLQLPHGFVWLGAGVALVMLLGTRSSTRYMTAEATAHDPSEIVVDEWAGQWLTFSVFYLLLLGVEGTRAAGVELIHSLMLEPRYLLAGFLLFRLFDILKPWPISWADRRVKGGFGVMFDDLLAGVAAGVFLFLLFLFVPHSPSFTS
jgi:phosphatidylglycerophosphatase A